MRWSADQFGRTRQASTSDLVTETADRVHLFPISGPVYGRAWCTIVTSNPESGLTATVRPIRPTDIPPLLAFRRRAAQTEITAHTWPKVQPESPRLPPVQLLSQSVTRPAGPRALVLRSDGGVAGVVIGRPRCDGLVWDVEHLHTEIDDNGASSDLLQHLEESVAEAGGRRLFLQVPEGSRGTEIARRAGYQRYTSERLYRLTPPFSSKQPNALPVRPRLRADEQPLFQLYSAAVPANVRAAEAMSNEEWSALHRGRKRWRPTLMGDRQQYVWEMGETLIGWLEITYGQKSQFLDLMVHPEYERLIDGIVAAALTQTSEKAPVYAAAREYQAALESSLDRYEFKLIGTSEIYVRQLAVRSREPALVPAKLVGG